LFELTGGATMTIDLDHNATTPLDPRVLDAMRPILLAGGNADSRHALGRAARRALEQAKQTVARVLGADPAEVIFTSGGTEANNLAMFGLPRNMDFGVSHIIASPVEHPAVAEPLAVLERERGFVVDRPAVDRQGVADPSAMAECIHPSTCLATLMLANNETGAIQPVAELARLAQERGVPVHTDAVQAVGRIPVDFHALGVTTLAASSHKLGGPVGVGVLLVKSGTWLPPLLHGGGQQGGRRPGTVAVALAVGMAEALDLWDREQVERTSRWLALRDRLEAALTASLGADRVILNGPRDARLPQTLNVGFPGLDGNALLMGLDLAGVSASLGSACASGATTASPTLLAMGVPADRLRSSVRFSLGINTTETQIDEAAERIVKVVTQVQAE
jgi:cysteine desulfurase